MFRKKKFCFRLFSWLFSLKRFLANPILLVIVFELDILHSYGKIPVNKLSDQERQKRIEHLQ